MATIKRVYDSFVNSTDASVAVLKNYCGEMSPRLRSALSSSVNRDRRIILPEPVGRLISGTLIVTFLVFVLVVVGGVSLGVLYLEWQRRVNSVSREIIREYDEFSDDLRVVLENERVRNGYGPALPEPIPGVRGVVCFFRAGNRKRMSYAVAYEAYRQFGARPKSEANVLITRKFMRDLLAEFKDLRTKDCCVIIDAALSLSFLPMVVLQDMNTMERSSWVWFFRSRVVVSWWLWLISGLRPSEAP